jgi:hypothetical protein
MMPDAGIPEWEAERGGNQRREESVCDSTATALPAPVALQPVNDPRPRKRVEDQAQHRRAAARHDHHVEAAAGEGAVA